MVKPYQEPDCEVCLMLSKARGQGTSRDRTRGQVIRYTLPAVSLPGRRRRHIQSRT